MTDEAYIFRSEVADKKRTARGALAKKCGSKSKRCTLPSDYLSYAQKKKLNGKERTMKLNKPITYKELKQFSYQTQRDYLQHLIDTYSARKTDLAKMLGISDNYFTTCVQKTLPEPLVAPHIGGKGSGGVSPRWTAFLNGNTDFTDDEVIIADREITYDDVEVVDSVHSTVDNVITVSTSQAVKDTSTKPKVKLDNLDISLTASIDELMTFAIDYLDEHKRYKFRLVVSDADGESA